MNRIRRVTLATPMAVAMALGALTACANPTAGAPGPTVPATSKPMGSRLPTPIQPEGNELPRNNSTTAPGATLPWSLVSVDKRLTASISARRRNPAPFLRKSG
jgi:hypothetical protein